jgi:hypothetical protein
MERTARKLFDNRTSPTPRCAALAHLLVEQDVRAAKLIDDCSDRPHEQLTALGAASCQLSRPDRGGQQQ